MTAAAVFAVSLAAAAFGAYPVALAGGVLGVVLLLGDRVETGAAQADNTDGEQAAGCAGLLYWIIAGAIGAVVLVLAALATIGAGQ